jgi:hypothetical protein
MSFKYFVQLAVALFASSLALAPTIVRGQAAEDVILVEACRSDVESPAAGKLGIGTPTRHIIALELRSMLDGTDFARSHDALAQELLAVEAEDGQDLSTESGEKHAGPSKPLYLKFPLDEQAEALRDASRALLDMAVSLEKAGLTRHADTLREAAWNMRMESNRAFMPIGSRVLIVPWLTGSRTPEQLLEDWEHLPDHLKPKKVVVPISYFGGLQR